MEYLNLTKELEGYLHPDLESVWNEWIQTSEGERIHEETKRVSGWDRIQEDDWFLKIWACLKRYPETLDDNEKYQSVINLIEILGYPFITNEYYNSQILRVEDQKGKPYAALLDKQIAYMCSEKSLGSMNDYQWNSVGIIDNLKQISKTINETVISGKIMKFRKPKEFEYFTNLRTEFPYFAYLSLYSSPIRDSYMETYKMSYQRMTYVLPPAIFMRGRKMALMNWRTLPF